MPVPPFRARIARPGSPGTEWSLSANLPRRVETGRFRGLATAQDHATVLNGVEKSGLEMNEVGENGVLADVTVLTVRLEGPGGMSNEFR
jgi:hypothetical protein